MAPTANAADSGPLVSIVCVVFNGEETLRRTLVSVIRQEYPNLEIILCDDGSTDASRTICREYAARHSNVRYLENEKKLGAVVNLNRLSLLADGDYFLWVRQEDVLDPTYVERCVRVLESDPEAVLCHSHGIVLSQTFSGLEDVSTLDHVDNEAGVVKRYWRFIRAYPDSAFTGLLRSGALRAAVASRPDLGPSNGLLLELLLRGKFRQVPEALHFFSRDRPPAPPLSGVARNRTRGILASERGLSSKCLLVAAVWANAALVNAKAAIRRLELVT